ncbi:Trm112 family protein [Sulfuracidifex metallicus]|uniref:Trm112 family protein n=1 Tax=Sulfuracidifex metallicus TaxID=47303 RepID=UPI00227572A8|nr:Trm112 family protein [Sulfuracidifex metallicus]MCY0849313.1 Trm112 family protein [Sulfuracidifex metallicus]
MKYRLMDVLACPICKNFPLTMLVFNEKEVERKNADIKKPICEIFCSFKKDFVRKLDTTPCEECESKEIIEGILVCDKCNRWYPIIDEIPRMLPDGLRKKEDDIKFLKAHENEIEDRVKKNGLPFNLSEV